MKEVVLSAEQYETFIRAISVLKDNCNDVDIRDGFIRQRTTKKSNIFQIDLTPLISDLSIPITVLKFKLDLFKILLGKDVAIRVTDTTFVFEDNMSSMTFSKPDLSFMDNVYMSSEGLSALFDLNEENIVLSNTLPPIVSDRIKIATQNLNVPSVQILFSSGKASIFIENQSKDQNIVVIKDLVSELDGKFSSSTDPTPFIVDHDGETSFKMFTKQQGDSNCITEFKTLLGDLDMTIYGMTELEKIDE